MASTEEGKSSRVGVVLHDPTVDGCSRLILPDGEIELIESDLADEDIAARFGIDAVRHAEALDWCRGICLDGPLAGRPVYTLNRVGSKVRISLPPQSGSGPAEYEVTRISSDGNPAELRFSHA